MKICLLCEGCYPYIVGGVSSWVQQLIENFPEYEFEVYAIGADLAKKGDFAFKLPENLTNVTEVFLNEAYIASSSVPLRDIKQWEIEEIRKLMLSNPDKWSTVFDFFLKNKHVVSDFLMSRYFFDITVEVYNSEYSDTIFIDFLWTMRSMYLTLFHVLNNPPPKADLYHTVSTGYAGIAAAVAKHLYGSPIILTEHGIYTREREEEIIKADWVGGVFKSLWINYFKSLSIGCYKYSDKIISLFEFNSKIQVELGADRLKCQVVANGINIKAFDDLPKKNKDDFYINVGAVIRVTPIKDIKTMIYAFDIVKREVPNTKFYIMGPTDEDPEYYDECVALLNELDTKDVIFTGRINVKDYLNKMDVMVLSSISEAQPLSLMEAMIAKKPCVSTNVGCCIELLEGKTGDNYGVSGFIAPVMNFEKLAEKIITIIKNPELSEKMGQAGYNRISNLYTEKKFIDSYKELYNSFDIKPGNMISDNQIYFYNRDELKNMKKNKLINKYLELQNILKESQKLNNKLKSNNEILLKENYELYKKIEINKAQ